MSKSDENVKTDIDQMNETQTSSDQAAKIDEKPTEDAQPTSNTDNASTVEDIDEELDSLLDSVVEDFKDTNLSDYRLQGATPSKTQTPGVQAASPLDGAQAPGQASAAQADGSEGNHAGFPADPLNFDPSSMSASDMDAQIRQLFGDDKQLLESFENLGQSAEEQGANSNPQSFAETLSQTLNSLGENAENLKNTEFDEDAFMRSLGGSMNVDPGADGGQAGDFLPMMQNMMHSLLSKEVLYPSLKDMADKYPEWLTANKSSTQKPQFDKYARQFDIVGKLLDEYDSESPSEPSTVKEQRFERILDLMTKMQDCGPPPKEIVSSLAPGLNFDAEGNPMMPGLPNLDQQCPMM